VHLNNSTQSIPKLTFQVIRRSIATLGQRKVTIKMFKASQDILVLPRRLTFTCRKFHKACKLRLMQSMQSLDNIKTYETPLENFSRSCVFTISSRTASFAWKRSQNLASLQVFSNQKYTLSPPHSLWGNWGQFRGDFSRQPLPIWEEFQQFLERRLSR
jgi:hypothetical protein